MVLGDQRAIRLLNIYVIMLQKMTFLLNLIKTNNNDGGQYSQPASLNDHIVACNDG